MRFKPLGIAESAYHFALAAHEAVRQKRKYTGDPYISHPVRVAKLVRSVSHTPEMVAAAYLHDVVEDTGVSLLTIQDVFGDDVAYYVGLLIDMKNPNLNRKARKTLDRSRLARAEQEVQTIKLADLIDNTESIVAHDPGFAVVYLREKRSLLEVMTKGDETLNEMAWTLLEQGEKALWKK